MQHRNGKRGPLAHDVNTRLALGALNAGIGHTHVNSLLSCLDIPTVNHVTFKVREREIGKAVESIASESCLENCCKEREMAIAAGTKCDSENLVGVMYSYDMGWQKRGKAHNSSTGHGAVLGVKTGKVLDFATRNKTCRTCAASRKPDKPTSHDCRKNHTGSAKIMESSVACQLFQRAPARGIKYDQYIGDDDSTTFSYLKTNVPYGLEKISDFIHTKRSLNTRLYNLSQRQKFPDSSVLSQKVVNYLVKCFSYCVHQHKNQPAELAIAIQWIVPHAFGDHKNCNPSWCRYKQYPTEYIHHELPYGKDLHGSNLQQALHDLFSEYASPTVVTKLAPCLDSQRNESLNGTIGSKNLKVRHYGGSESSDFRTACGVAQHNEGHKFVCKALIKTGINPGPNCTSYQETQDKIATATKQRKSTKKFKVRRRQLHLNRFQSTVRNENREGLSYKHDIGLNFDPKVCGHTHDYKILQKVNKNTCKTELKEYEQLIPPSDVRPLLKEILFDPQKTYKFILFDTETSSTTKRTELLQLSAITDDGDQSFSEYILPVCSISSSATAVHNITIRFSGDQRILCKSGKPVPAKPLQTCLQSFLQFLDVCASNSVDYLVLLGHNASVFDTPRLLLSAGPTFTCTLTKMKVLFADSLSLLKALRRQPNSPLKSATNKLSDVYETLFSAKFEAHDALEDVKALRKILFTGPLQISGEQVVNHGNCVSANEAFDEAIFLERRKATILTFDGKLNLSSSIVQKLADAGLSYRKLQSLYEKFNINGLYGVLALAPTANSSSGRRKSNSARVTSNKRILSEILSHFQQS